MPPQLLLLLLLFTPYNAQPAKRVNVFALLSGTLRTYQRAGCDGDVVTLKCPRGTGISIEVAQYGKSSATKDLCALKPTTTSFSNPEYNYNSSCLWPKTLQYSLLQTVVETCQKKLSCKFKTSPKTFGGDPCPGIPKYVEVAYKCRPNEFRSKVACENERIELKCHPNQRVAVYSASYGRTEYESIQCPQPQGVPEETCLVSYATETVMLRCHGQRRCELTADSNTFGAICRENSRKYLKVVYTCVPRKVLKEKYEGNLEADEKESDQDFSHDDELDFDSYDAENEFIRESAASPPAPNIEGPKTDNSTKDQTVANAKNPSKKNGLDFAFQPNATPSFPQIHSTMQAPDPNCTLTAPSKEEKAVGFVSDWIDAYTFLSQNQEKFLLYLIVSVGAAVLLLLSFLVVRLLVQRHRARKEAKFHATNISDHTLPNGFTDDISEVDADIELPMPVPAVTIHPAPVGSIAEVIRYPHMHSHTLRRPMTDLEAPRSLSSASSTHYYYG